MIRSLVGLVLVSILVLLSSVALPHSDAEWIQRGEYKNAVGELCCGERDCHELSGDDIRITPAGYFIKSLNETVPYHEATPSPTGTYWVCIWGGKRRCFFAPPPGS